MRRGGPARVVAGGIAAALLLTGATPGGKPPDPPHIEDQDECRVGHFGAKRWPGACWRPYANSSPFNQPLPKRPRLHPDSVRIVRRITSFGPPNHLIAGQAGTRHDFFHPVYYARASDPEFTIRCVRPWGTCAIEGHAVRIPDAARRAAGGDAHLTVVDQESGWEYDLWDVRSKPKGGGTLRTGWGGRTRIDGDGLGSAGTASGFGGLAGIIRGPELAAGEIDHALFMTVRCDSGTRVPPAVKDGAACDEPSGAPPMGARLQLDMTRREIKALDAPAWKKTVLRAMAKYGMFVGDTGGGAWAVHLESGQTYRSFGYEDATVVFARDHGWRRDSAGDYVGKLRGGVDWADRLRVIHPCVSDGSCPER